MGVAYLGVMNWGDMSWETVFLKAESPMLIFIGLLSVFVREGGAWGFEREASLLAVLGRFLDKALVFFDRLTLYSSPLTSCIIMV